MQALKDMKEAYSEQLEAEKRATRDAKSEVEALLQLQHAQVRSVRGSWNYG